MSFSASARVRIFVNVEALIAPPEEPVAFVNLPVNAPSQDMQLKVYGPCGRHYNSVF
jgi:hypothetical protein